MDGVYVPSLGKNVPGLLFADDAVVISNTPESLQNSLNLLSNWANTWEMKINSSKCGILRIGSKINSPFTAQNQNIEIFKNKIILDTYLMMIGRRHPTSKK
ncbi:hypothetical protein AYI68_g1410 [Smittium mucronatum]|uniref:Reverse transcriptase domain-containing protein n=1 Tax=Smittium mucronatum TaxID=133383 RepID=A0A1R0H5H0_9FUNG|nr:hypothetical protein AYI68_g1410 [Smittium mucronatum]